MELWLAVLALVACAEKKKPAPPAEPVPSASAAPTGPCAADASVDPSQSEMRPAVTAFKNKEYEKAQAAFGDLAKRYPESSTVRVWQGDTFLFDKAAKTEAAAADTALPYYKEAEKLHDQGCRLPEYEHYYLRMDFAYSYLRKRTPDDALLHLEIAKKYWDNSAEVFYHLARAYCLKNDVTQCASNFEKALELAAAFRRPKFLRTHHSLDDWIRRSKTQSEFPPLRKDKRYAEIVAKAAKAERK